MAIFIVEAKIRVSLEADTAEGALATARETFGEIPIDEFEFSVEAQE